MTLLAGMLVQTCSHVMHLVEDNLFVPAVEATDETSAIVLGSTAAPCARII